MFNDTISFGSYMFFVCRGNKVVGFKIRYELDKNKFYSWLGGVDTNYGKYLTKNSVARF